MIHIAGSLLFLFFALIASPDWPDLDRLFHNPNGVADVVFQFELLALFYLNYYLLFDKFYSTKKFVVFFLIQFALLLLFVPAMDFVVHRLMPDPYHHGMRAGPPHQGVISIILFNRKVYIFLLVVVGTILIKTRNRLKAIEKEKAITELSFLKAQINPHFLFNTLNSIYSLAIQKSDAAPDAIVKLSGMMRYVLQDAQQSFVPLESEINYIKDFIDLQKLRIDDSVKLTYSVKGDLRGEKIAPLILISFIENAFKYGVNSELKSEIEINIACEKAWLFFTVKNNKVKTTLSDIPTTRLGLINTKKRLELLYPAAHVLNIEDNEKEFLVDLKIRLQ